jgi:hypothetical protein
LLLPVEVFLLSGLACDVFASFCANMQVEISTITIKIDRKRFKNTFAEAAQDICGFLQADGKL